MKMEMKKETFTNEKEAQKFARKNKAITIQLHRAEYGNEVFYEVFYYENQKKI